MKNEEKVFDEEGTDINVKDGFHYVSVYTFSIVCFQLVFLFTVIIYCQSLSAV